MSALLVAVWLVSGCSDANAGPKSPRDVRLPRKPFSVGSPEQYREPGVYDDFRDSHGVWIVSDGNNVVALAALCPEGDPKLPRYEGCGTTFDTLSGRFRCSCDGSTFSREGLKPNSSRAEDSMRRCRIELVNGQLVVSATRRYSQVRNQWSSIYSMFLFEELDEPPEPVKSAWRRFN